MIIKVSYNKNTKEILISDDYIAIDGSDPQILEFNENTFVETDDKISFEIALQTTVFEERRDEHLNGDNN